MSSNGLFWQLGAGVSFILLIVYIIYESLRFNGSEGFLTNVMIEKIYRNWFKKNRTSLIKSDLKIHELNLIVYKFKEELVSSGISQETVQKYIENLKINNSTEGKFFKNFFGGILAFVSTSNMMSILFDNLFKSNQSEGSASSIIKGSMIESIVLIALILIYIIGLVAIIYFIFNMENRQLNKLRLGLLEQVCLIWEYPVDETSDPDPNAINIIFLKQKNEKSRFEIKFDKIVGYQVKANSNFVIKCFTKLIIKLQWLIKVIDFLLGFVIPVFITGINILIVEETNWLFNQFHFAWYGWLFIILFIISIIFMESVHMIFLNSQFLGNQNNVNRKKVFNNIKYYKYRWYNFLQLLFYFVIYVIGWMFLKDNFNIINCSFIIFIVLHCVISIISTKFFIDDEKYAS